MKSHYKKQILILVLLLSIISITDLLAQKKNPSCAFETPTVTPTMRVPDNWHINTMSYHQNGAYDSAISCFNISVHIIRRSDETGGVSSTDVTSQVNDMIATFQQHNINLYWDNKTIRYIDDTSLYNIPTSAYGSSYFVPNTINIYYTESNNGPSGSSTNTTEILMYSQNIDSSTLMHEMGHQFGLMHTHHATTNAFTEGEHYYEDDEEINGSNSAYAGDWIFDTPADDQSLDGTTSPNACYPGEPNALGYEPDPTNFMSYAHSECRTNFTPGQVTRMRHFIASGIMPHLNMAQIECPVPDTCFIGCKPAKKAAEDIFFGYTLEGTSFTITPLNFSTGGSSFSVSNFSSLATDCNFSYEISYDGGINFYNLPVTGFSSTTIDNSECMIQLKITNADSGTVCCYSITCQDISVRDIVECDTSNPCTAPDCAAFANTIDINSALQVSPSDPCTYTLSLDSPSSCFKIIVNWGDGTIENIDLGSGSTQLNHIYITGTYAVTLTILSDDDSCQQTLTSNSFNPQCGTQCDDCNEIGAGIINSIQESTKVQCSYTASIPDLSNSCLSGTINWGDNSSTENLVYGNMSHTYSSSGMYNIVVTINDIEGYLCYQQTQSVNIDCGSTEPSCPPSSCLDIVTPSVYCSEASIWMNCNDPSITSIKWYYTLSGSYIHQYFGTSTGNPAGQHAQPLYLPSPPFGSSWNGYILTVYAEVYFGSTTCSEISTSTRLSCSTGGGGDPMMRVNSDTKKSRKDLLDDIDIDLSKNPIKANQELNFTGIDYKNVIGIEVLDVYGNPKITMKPSRNGLNIGRLATGLYFIRFTTKYGSIQKKLIIE